MIWKRIFKKQKPKQPVVEKLSLNELKQKSASLKSEELDKIQRALEEPFKRFVRVKEQLLKEVKALSKSDAVEEIHPGLYKSALEARRLLVEKLTRPLAEFNPRKVASLDELLSLKENFARVVNQTTKAISAHGGYTRAVFGQHMKSLKLHLGELHEVTKGIMKSIDGVADRLQSIDRLSSKVESLSALEKEIKQTEEEITSLKQNTGDLEKAVEVKKREFSEFLESDDFKRVEELSQEIKKVESEITDVKRNAERKVSGLNRTLRKFEKMVHGGKEKLDKDQRLLLALFIKDPSSLFSTREKAEAAQSFLAFVFPHLEKAAFEKDERERAKILDVVREILSKNLLVGFYEKIQELEKKREDLLKLWEKLPHLHRGELQQAVKDAEAALDENKTRIEVKEKKLKEFQNEFEKRRNEVINMAQEVLGVKVELTSS